MDDIFVARLMSSDVRTVGPDALVEDAAQQMLEDEIGSVVVVDDEDHLEGILTNTDFVQIVAERRPKDQTPVGEYMSTDLVTVGPNDTIQDAADLLIEHGIHHLPVVTAEDVVIGILTTTDLTNYVSLIETPDVPEPNA